MVEAALFLVVAAVIAAAVVLFKIFSSILKTVLVLGALLSISAAVAGGILYKDVMDLKSNFQDKDNLLLLSNNEGTALTTGIVIKGLESMPPSKSSNITNIVPLSQAELEKLSAFLPQRDYAAMRGGSFKLVILREGSFTNLPETISFQGQDFSRELVLSQLASATGEERANIISGFVAYRLQNEPLFLLTDYRKGEAVIYPETPVFKLVKVLPEGMLQAVNDRVMESFSRQSGELVWSYGKSR